MARRKSKLGHDDEEGANEERWLLTYADMITLLMVLFIVLFAIGQIDQKKFDKLHDGLSQSFGEATILDGGAGVLDSSSVQAPAPDDSRAGQQALERQRQAMLAASRAADAMAQKQAAAKRQEMAVLEASFTTALAKQGLAGSVEFQEGDRRGLVVNIVTDKVLFDLGEATLRPQGTKVLDTLAPLLKKLPNGLVIEGHTDNQPISDSRFASNWELSTERATTVLRHLLADGVGASKVAAAGYADQRPLKAGNSAASRARNRRVAIVILAQPAVAPSVSAAGSLPSVSGV
ncbi:MAG: flagellar motor protein MotB [Dermatophilaceae bacterium]